MAYDSPTPDSSGQDANTVSSDPNFNPPLVEFAPVAIKTIPPARGSMFYSIGSNPFYLLSACCMLGGSLALTNSLSWLSIPLSRLITLIGTLNVYEVSLIALAWFLIRGRAQYRDGVMLLILEAFFLLDVTFLDAEVATKDRYYGLAVNGLMLAAAAVKLLLVLNLLGFRRPFLPFAFFMTQFAATLALPIIFGWRAERVTPMYFYAAYWAAGLLLASHAVVIQYLRGQKIARELMPAAVTFLALPWLSFATHLGILHYVHDLDFMGAYAAPLLLGFTIVLQSAAPTRLASRGNLVALKILLPMAAILVSSGNPVQLYVLNKAGLLMISPVRLAIGCAYLVMVYCFLRNLWILMMAAGAVAVGLAIFGPSPDEVYTWAARASRRTASTAWDLAPKTTTQWGVVAVGAAFAFLALGATISIRRSSPHPEGNAP